LKLAASERFQMNNTKLLHGFFAAFLREAVWCWPAGTAHILKDLGEQAYF